MEVTAGTAQRGEHQVTIAPGGTTGRHFHQGTLYALVKAGTLSHAGADCTTTDVYPAGAPLSDDAPDPGCGS